MKNRTIAFTSVFTGIFLFGVSMVLLGALLPILKVRFGLNDIEAGGLFSVLPFGLLVGSVVFGPLADKYGYRWVLFSAGMLLALGFWGIAHATSIHLLHVCIFLFGAGGGIMNGASSALTADLSENEHKISNLNWLGAFFGIGAFCMPIALSVTDQSYYTLLIDIACMLSFAVAVLFAVIHYPISVRKEKVSLQLLPVFVKNTTFLVICFFLFFQSAFEAIINNWSVSYFMGKAGVNQEQALQALSLSVLGMVVMRMLTGSVLQKVSPLRLILMALLLLSGGAVYLTLSGSFVVKGIGMFLLGAGLATGFPVMLGLIGGMFKETSATAFSFAMVIALAGNMIINYGMGYFTERYGIGSFPLIIIAEIGAMTLIFVLIKGRQEKARNRNN